MSQETEWRTDVHDGYRTKIIRVGNSTLEINRPILSPEEQKEREEAVKDFLRKYR